MSIFKVQLDEALGRLATAPTRRHGGTRLRSSIALQSPIELLHTESKVLPDRLRAESGPTILEDSLRAITPLRLYH